MWVFYEYAKLSLDFGLFPQKVWKVLLTTVAVLAMLVINSPASATPPSEPTTVTGLGASTGWYSDDTRNASGVDLVGTNFTQYGKPGQTPSTADDTAISQQLQFVDGPAGSTGGGSVKIIAPTENPGKSTLSTVNLDGFAAASVLTDDSFSASYRWYKEPNPTSRTVAFRIGIQSTAWAASQVDFTATRSGEQTWDLMLVNLMDVSEDNAWNEVDVNKDTGTWHLYGQSGNQNWIGITGVVPPGGSSAKTLAEWAVDSVWGNRLFGTDAKITNVQFGLGSWQRQANAYIDYLETTILNNGNRINFAAPVLVVDGTTSEIKSGHTTIQSAINAAAEGDTIQVAAGTYSENVNISKSLTILGANAGVNGSDDTRGTESTLRGHLVVASNGITIDGMAFDGGASAIRGESAANAYDDLTIINNWIENTTDTPIRFGLGTGGGLGSDNWTIANNRIGNITGNALTGMVLFNIDGLTVAGNVINHTNSGSMGRRGINLDGVINAVVSHNSIDLGLVAPSDVTVASGAAPWVIQISMSDRSVSNVTLSSNSVSGAYRGITSLSQRNMTDVTISNNTVNVMEGIVLNTGSVPPQVAGVTMGNVRVANNSITATSSAVFARALHNAHPNGPVTFNNLTVIDNTVTQGVVQIGRAETFVSSGASSSGDGFVHLVGNTTIDGSANDDVLQSKGVASVNFEAGGGNDVVVYLNPDDITNDTLNGDLGINEIRFASITAGQTLVLPSSITNFSSAKIADASGISTGTTALNLSALALSNTISLIGNDADNTLTGGSNNDTINGGAGNDTVTFAGNYADYTVSFSSTSVLVSGPDGNDSVTNVEKLQFADKAVIIVGSALGSAYTTISSGIAAANAGDVVQVAEGTYAPTSQVLINKSISIIGAGSESTTIDVGGYNAWGVYITADNVTLQGFTIQGNAATNQQYGLKVGTGNNTGPSVHINEGLTLSDIKVQGTRRTGLDLNGVRNATLQGIIATGATHGFGLSISSSHDVTITDLSTTGNAWGDVGIFPAQTVYQFPEIEDPSGIVFGGTIDLSSGNGSISVQDGALVSGGVWVGTISNDPTDNADITVPTDFSRVVNSTRIADGLIMHNVGLEPAINSLALTLVSSGLFANTAIVNLNSGFWEVIQGLTIQAAINAAAEGDTIQVGPGIYLETLDLNRNNLTVRSSDGAETTTIRGGGGAGAADAVVRFSANGVTLQGFTIDRANAAANSRAIAPMASDGATISNNIIVNSFRGIQGDFYGKPINLTISDNTFADTVQYGIAGTEDMANLTINDNTFRTTVEGIGLGVGVGLAGTPEQLFAGQIWQLSAGYAIKDYRVSGEPIIGAPYLAVPADLVIYQGAANSGQPAGVNLTATIPISLDTNGHAIGAATFSLASSSCFNVANPDTDVQLASGQSGVDLIATLNADDGALDIAIISASSLVNGLLVNVTVNYTTTNDCLNPGNGVTAVQFLTGNEAPTFGSVAGGSLTAGTSQNGSLRPRWGDCNGDGSIDAGDISACILEIFDRDGSSRTAARYAGTFAGTIFCDSNQDLKIDAGDLVCTVRTINSLTCTASVSAQSLSSVMVETSAVSDTAVQSSLVLNTNNSAAAAVFALEINPAYHFDATDSDGNGLPDALQLQIPADYQAAAVYDADTRLLQVIVASLSVPTVPLADGPLATLVLTSAGPVESAQPFTIQDISLGDVDGGSLPLEVVDLPTQMNSRLYLPSVIR